jgi:hypothetical protein
MDVILEIAYRFIKELDNEDNEDNEDNVMDKELQVIILGLMTIIAFRQWLLVTL